MADDKIDEKAIFNVARQINSPDARREYLRHVCGTDTALLARLETLLQAYAEQSSFLETPPAHSSSPTIDLPLIERAGTVIGPYKLLQQIGEGGMGVVYMAEQAKPIARMVALKIIKPGMDTQQVVARFEAERQALAMMDHPNIAKVLDAGTTASERPYFVMELVKGVPITNYCDDHHLTLKERLELFVRVLHAVQHAHQKGIIHRDIKPSNVLVAEYDQQAVPKVIDFGVAKATSQKLTDKTMFTHFGQLVGTLEYMSPEQAKLNQMDIDTRCDIYSLGVLLYELLTGDTPFDRKRLRSAAFEEMMRIIREEEPPVPSTRLSTSGMLASVSANRSTEPRKLSNFMRGELDWIVMRAMEKERSRRYETPNAFADDIQRFLNQEAVVARPVSTAYRMKKFAQRNWGAVIAGSVIAAALLIGLGTSTWFAVRESRAAAIALEAKEEANRQRELAQQNALEAMSAREAEAVERASAVKDRDRVATLNQAIEKQSEAQRRMLYISDMNLVQSAWEVDNVSRVLELLNAHRPKPGQTDLRGFEWHYWNRRCHSDLRTVKLSGTTPYTPAVFSADGKLLVGTRQDLSSPEGAPIIVWDTETGAELQSLGSHLSPILAATTLTWHPNGKHVAISGFDQSDIIRVQMLDLANDKVLFQIGEPRGVERLQEIFAGPSDLWFSGDGARLATVVGTRDGGLPMKSVVKYWNAQTGEELAAIPLPGERVSNVSISVDGARIAYASHTRATESSPSSESIIILNVETPDQEVTIPIPRPASFRFSPDGRQILVSGLANDSFRSGQEGGAGVFDTSAGHKLISMPDSDPWFIAKFSPDGQWLAVNTLSRPCSVKLYRTTGDRASAEFQGHTSSVKALSFSPDSKLLFTASADGVLKTFDISAIRSDPLMQASVSNLMQTFSVVSNDGRQIATAPRKLPFGGRLAATVASKSIVTVRDDSGKISFQTAEFDGLIRWMKFSVDGRRLAACSVNPNANASSAAQICVWDTTTGVERLSLRLRNDDTNSEPGAALSPDGRRLAVIVSHGPGTSQTSKIKVWEIDAKREVWESDEAKQYGADLLFSPNGRLILGVPAHFNTRLAVWDAEDGRLLWTDDTQIGGLTFSDDSMKIFGYRHASEKIQLWNARTGVELVSFLGPSFSLSIPDATKLSLSANGKHLAAMGRPPIGTRSNDAVVWDMIGPEREQLTLKGHSQIVRRVGSLAFSPDSRRIVTTAGSIASIGEIKLWDAESGQAVLTLPGAARNLRFASNGNVLVGEMGFNLVSEIRVERWDASPLSPHVEAEQMIEAFTSRSSSESLPLKSEILARIDADQALPEETRTAVVARVKGLRREKELNLEAWRIAHLASQPKEKYERALRYLEEAAKTDSDILDSLSTLALVHYRLRQPTQALAALERSLQLHAAKNLSLPADDYVTQAMIQFEAGQHQVSRSTLEQVWTSVSRSEAGWLKKLDPSLGYYRSQDHSALIRMLPEWQEMVREAETLIGVPNAADNPNSWIGKTFMPRWRNHGHSLNLPYRINRVEGDRLWFGKNSIARSEVIPLNDARQYYTRLLQYNPQSSVVQNHLGIASRASGKFEEAIEHYSAAIRLDPKQSVYFHNRGLVWQEDNREYDKALADYDEALRLSPNNAEYHVSRGFLRRQQGHLDDALKNFDEAIHLQSDLGSAHANRAIIWSVQGDKVKMQQDLDAAIRYSPDDPDTLRARAWLMATSPIAEHRNGKLAVTEGTTACDQLTGVADIYKFHDTLAAAYAETRDFEQAIKYQEKALALAPPAWHFEYQSRKRLYLEGKPYRDPMLSIPVVTGQ